MYVCMSLTNATNLCCLFQHPWALENDTARATTCLLHLTADVIKMNTYLKLQGSSYICSFLQGLKHRLWGPGEARHTSGGSSGCRASPGGNTGAATAQTRETGPHPLRQMALPLMSPLRLLNERVGHKLRKKLLLQKIKVLAFVKKNVFLQRKKFHEFNRKILTEIIIINSNILKKCLTFES